MNGSAVRQPGGVIIVALVCTLTAAGGGVDAIGWTLFDGLFIAHMSGNLIAAMALLGLGHGTAILRRATTIAGFGLGLALGATMEILARGGVRRFAGVASALALELALLAALTAIAVAMAPGGVVVPARGAMAYYGLPTAAAAAMGLQTASVRRIRAVHARTTFITGVLAREVEALVEILAARRTPARGTEEAARPRRSARLHLAVLGSYALGGLSSAMLERWAGAVALALPSFGVLVATVLARALAREPRDS